VSSGNGLLPALTGSLLRIAHVALAEASPRLEQAPLQQLQRSPSHNLAPAPQVGQGSTVSMANSVLK